MPRIIIVIAVLALSMACSASPDVVDDEPEALAPGIWNIQTGDRLEFDEFVDRLDDADFVLVGESHGTSWHHEVQRRIYDVLSDRNPGQIPLGMEMVERRFQDALDAYISGRFDESQMLSRVEWEDRWGVDDEVYAPLWRRAREEDQPVVALNARRELVRAVGESGIDGLSDTKREELPEIDKSDDAYREHLRQIFAAHGSEASSEDLDRFFEAMLVWDETMAQTAFDFMQKTAAHGPMVIVTGVGHIEGRFGIPNRLERRGAPPEAVITVVPVTDDDPRSTQFRDLDYLRDENVADYVWIEE